MLTFNTDPASKVRTTCRWFEQMSQPHLTFCMVTQSAGLVNSEWVTQWVCKSGADVIEDSEGFDIQMTDDKEFTSRRRAERSCSWGRRDGATFSNHCDSAAIECSFVILCWVYFQMTWISISLGKGTAEFHICNVSLFCPQKFISIGLFFFFLLCSHQFITGTIIQIHLL